MSGHDESLIEQAKRRAAYKAVDEHIPPDAKVIGIGSGSTVTYVVERIVQRGQELNKGVVFVPTGFQSRQLIIQNGLNLGDVDAYPEIDVAIDGADEVDDNLNCIKGGGACHLREKVIAEAAKKFVIVADSRKNSSILCQKWKRGIPIEVVPFAYSRVVIGLKNLGCKNPVLRIAVAKAGPIITDNGNFIIDADFGELFDPVELLHKIKLLTGVVEVGIFVDVVQFAYFGNEDGTITEKKKEW